MTTFARALWATLVVCGVACTQVDVHQTNQAKSQTCVSCHHEAYAQVQTPVHVGDGGLANPAKPNTCQDCHTTKAWVPASGGEHPEVKFPITTGVHASIACSDCHIAALGANTAGANTDCIHCHTGDHTIPSIDSKHVGVANYTAADPNNPHSCLACHDAGQHLNGHPEAKFPITTGKHHNPAINCGDCHIASLGANTAGANTDCIHCHIGAHTLASIDATHNPVPANYTPANASTPHSCLTCHNMGQRL